MPRIYTSASDPVDYCRFCFPSESAAQRRWGNVETMGEGPDGRGDCFAYDAEHPDYDGEDYDCERCHTRLTSADNDAEDAPEPRKLSAAEVLEAADYYDRRRKPRAYYNVEPTVVERD